VHRQCTDSAQTIPVWYEGNTIYNRKMEYEIDLIDLAKNVMIIKLILIRVGL